MNRNESRSAKKKLLLGFAIALGLVPVLLLWWSRNPIVFTVPEGLLSEISARQVEDPSGRAIVVELELSGDTTGYTISELSLSRELADGLGLSPPEGFHEELLPLEEEDLSDPETVDFVNEWNQENLRWTGDLEILPGSPITIRLPATEPLASSGELTISYEHVSMIGGLWSSTIVVLNEAEGSLVQLDAPPRRRQPRPAGGRSGAGPSAPAE